MLFKPSSAFFCISLILFTLVNTTYAFSGGVRGVVKDENSEPLAFATIFVKQTGSGTTTNINGEYDLTLPAGSYEISFQFLGYETVVKQIHITATFEEVDVVLKSQATMLQTVTVNAGKEDPAYTIMRKAIAKATYHRNQLDSYSARVYIKGTGQLKDYPWLAKRQLEKEGITKDRVYISESVSEIKYTRPNKFEEKVISIHSDGKDNNTSPNPFIFGSFYEPEVAETVSPLSPKAFSYYRFEYQGTFKDRDYEISRIRVTPRSRGDNVVEGMLYIVENWWSIHSMDMKTTKLGIEIGIKGVYAPIEDKAWLPVSHRFNIHGKIFGFEFEYNYLATLSAYKIQINPELYVEPGEMEVVDEKIEKAEARKIEDAQRKNKSDDKAKELQQRLESGKEITRKELRTLMKEYEKNEVKEQKEPEVVFHNTHSIDSGAFKKDAAYWAEVRPVPLTQKEIKGYEKSDSMAVIEKKRQSGDTLKVSKHKGFQPWDLLTGDHYSVSDHSNFRIYFPFGGFNTVEGWNLIYRVGFGTILQDTNKTRLNIDPTFRYAFSRKKASGNLKFSLRNKQSRFEVEGGRYVEQLNHDRPIHPIVNTLTTLLMEQNLMKLYEQDYVNTTYRKKINPFFSFHTKWSWAKRYALENNADYTLVDRSKREYMSNEPVNVEIGSTAFPQHEAFVGSIGFQSRPWLKFRERNGERSEISTSSPLFSFNYTKGFSGVLGSDVSYDMVEMGIKHRFDIGVRGDVDVALNAGVFLNSDKMYFMDFKHFLGNRTPFSTADPVGSFRLLDYYLHSTSDRYVSLNVHYKFRKFLVTRIPTIRMMGIRENIFVNYLATPTTKNYTEVGYSIDGILRIFRLEAAASFVDGEYLDYGFRLGVTTNLAITFGE